MRRVKLATLENAMRLVRSGDTITVSGFVSHGAPEALLRQLGSTTGVYGLNLLFEGGPGDFATRGLNHLARPGMLDRVIGAHYGQVPKLAKLALSNQVAAYALPMGAVSRMIRAASAHSPGHTTRVGLGTFVDPRNGGGKLNQRAIDAGDVVEVITLDGQEYLHYKALPIRVALVRGTTGDSAGNISFERESLLTDARIMCAAAKASGGIVICQVARVAEVNSIPPRSVHIPSALVDAVVHAPDDGDQGYFTSYNPSWAGELKVLSNSGGEVKAAPLDARKIIGRRAAMELLRDDVVNLGIGMPEMVAEVCREELIDKCVTLTTEAGVVGGVGASGHDFGAAQNYDALVEINQMFDFYNGGGLSVCFLGMGQLDPSCGDVNVSRLSQDTLTGPGGFVDISQCTRRIVFMGTFTKKGLDVAVKDGGLVIVKEGGLRACVKGVREISFSGKMAVENGQQVLYVTERAVFRLGETGLELIEVAKGIDVKRDVLDLMDTPCAVSPQLKLMDERIFEPSLMGLKADLTDLRRVLAKRCKYFRSVNALYIDLSGVTVTSSEDVRLAEHTIREIVAQNGASSVDAVVRYDDFAISPKLAGEYISMIKRLGSDVFSSVKRFTSRAHSSPNFGGLQLDEGAVDFWTRYANGADSMSRSDLRAAIEKEFKYKVSATALAKAVRSNNAVSREEIGQVLAQLVGGIEQETSERQPMLLMKDAVFGSGKQ